MEICYLDNAATTKPFNELQQIFETCHQHYYNPSALYQGAVDARINLENARKNICKLLGGENGTIVFTGSATEANNLALSSVNLKDKKLLVFVGEHPSVYNKAKQLSETGVNVQFLGCNKDGQIILPNANDVLQAGMISVMHVSNETGSINDIKTLCNYVKQINPKIIVHSDGVQAFGKIKVDLMDLGVDMYTISAHKINGPKGIAALWVKKGINIKPQVIGGGQESGLRSGTENVFGILSLEYCSNKLVSELPTNYNKVENLKNQFVNNLKNSGLNFIVNGDTCSPYILNMTIPGVRGEVLLHLLEQQYILLSTGSACSSKKPDNRMLKAMGVSDEFIKQSIRLSFNAYDNIDVVLASDTIAQVAKQALARVKSKR